jgi:hypothetical protein
MVQLPLAVLAALVRHPLLELAVQSFTVVAVVVAGITELPPPLQEEMVAEVLAVFLELAQLPVLAVLQILAAVVAVAAEI